MNQGIELADGGEHEDVGPALGVVGEVLEGDEGRDEKGKGFAGGSQP
jgi:hypothetical protein